MAVILGKPIEAHIQKPTSPVRLMVKSKDELQQFRCGNCGALLLKGLNLEKAQIEVKCRNCGTLLVSPGMSVVE